MSSQNTLITCANDNEIKRPSGVLISRQFYRDKSVQGLGVYKAMDEDGNVEIIGGPGDSAQPYSDIAIATNDITTQSITDVVATGMTLTPPAGTYLVWFNGSISVDNGTKAYASIYSNSIQIASSEIPCEGGGSDISSAFPCIAKVTVNGSQDIEGKWRIVAEGQTGTMHQRNLLIQKTKP